LHHAQCLSNDGDQLLLLLLLLLLRLLFLLLMEERHSSGPLCIQGQAAVRRSMFRKNCIPNLQKTFASQTMPKAPSKQIEKPNLSPQSLNHNLQTSNHKL